MTSDRVERLLDLHGDMIFTLCTRLAGAEREDLFQETFLRLLSIPDVEMDHDKTRNLLYTICLNAFRNQHAKRKRWRQIFSQQPLDVTLSAKNNTEEDFMQGQVLWDIRVAVLRLAPRYRIPIIMHYFAGWSSVQIATAMGMKETTIRSRMHRARKMLRDRLEEKDEEEH